MTKGVYREDKHLCRLTNDYLNQLLDLQNNERSMYHDYSNFKHCVDGCCACIDSFL